MNNKSIKKLVFIFTVICGALALINTAYCYLLPMYLSYKFNTDLKSASSIGIIGGADGPTSIFVASSQSPKLNITAIFALLTVVGIIYLINAKRKNS